MKFKCERTGRILEPKNPSVIRQDTEGNLYVVTPHGYAFPVVEEVKKETPKPAPKKAPAKKEVKED